MSPGSGNYSELVRHVRYPGVHLSFIWLIYTHDREKRENVPKFGVIQENVVAPSHFKGKKHLPPPPPFAIKRLKK